MPRTVTRLGPVRVLGLVLVLWWPPPSARAQTSAVVGLPIVDVQVEQEGRPVTDRVIAALVETAVGEPLSMRDVRQTIDHLFGLGRYDDVQVLTERAGEGVALRYVLVPRHEVQAVEFRGSLGLSESALRQAMTERFGALPAAGRAADVARLFEGLYQDRGYVRATVTPRVAEFHDPDRATLIFDIDSGPRATIRAVEVEGLDAAGRTALLRDVEVRAGQPYDGVTLQRRLEDYERALRGRGYYEARATHSADFTAAGDANLTIAVDRGPRVAVAFAGDRLPPEVRSELVPVQREGSVDEDLLEDASRAIEDYLRARGYRDARSEYSREERNGELTVTYTVTRGPRHLVDTVTIEGNTAILDEELRELLGIATGEPFLQSALDAGVDAVRRAYTDRGFTRVAVRPLVSLLPAAGSGAAADRHVEVRLNVTEGARTVVASIDLQGNTVLTEEQIRSVMATTPGRPYSEAQLAQDRDRIQLEYLNRGYQSAVVEPRVVLSDDNTRADVRVAVSEGPQILIDQVIVIGNERTSTETIERELLLKPGQPLGYSALLESQQRLAALGLFRRVRIEELRHGSEPRRDILVQVEEAPPTTIGYGGGLEGGNRLRPTAEGGVAEERFEIAPRGFFEIGRRNLWGKNRSINLFTRVSLRSRDIVLDETGAPLPEPEQRSNYGFNEYRVVASYREPKFLDSPADVLVTGIIDQAIRSSFNFITREVRAEAGWRASRRYSVAGRYSYQHTELFDERFSEEDKPLIDRLFPQVRLSKFSVSVLRDTRDDVLDPNGGTFVSADTDLAARAFGSEVGFAKTFLQGFTFYRLPGQRRTVLALAARVGLAHGFRREVTRTDTAGNPITGPDGEPLVETVEDLPASERFFAGGDTTVRGFSLDRLGNEATISPTGFPTGGNGLVVLNTELRVGIWRGLGVVGFLDAGNVYPKAGDLDFTDLRAAAGFGLRYRSPVGPIRIDWGFKLDRRELVPGQLERRSVLHVSLGQAF